MPKCNLKLKRFCNFIDCYDNVTFEPQPVVTDAGGGGLMRGEEPRRWTRPDG